MIGCVIERICEALAIRRLEMRHFRRSTPDLAAASAATFSPHNLRRQKPKRRWLESRHFQKRRGDTRR